MWNDYLFYCVYINTEKNYYQRWRKQENATGQSFKKKVVLQLIYKTCTLTIKILVSLQWQSRSLQRKSDVSHLGLLNIARSWCKLFIYVNNKGRWMKNGGQPLNGIDKK